MLTLLQDPEWTSFLSISEQKISKNDTRRYFSMNDTNYICQLLFDLFPAPFTTGNFYTSNIFTEASWGIKTGVQ